MAETQRVELKDGNWADVIVRKFLVSDLRYQRIEAHERGFSDPTLDAMALLKIRVTGWSFGAVTDDTIDALDIDDALALLNVVRGQDDGTPNSSSSSRNGTARKRAKRRTPAATRPGSGS